MWREVMQAEPPPVTDPYTEVTTDDRPLDGADLDAARPRPP
jgi:hypothetical protein